MAEKLFSDLDLDVEVDARAGYRLKYLEVFNWGTFNGQVWRLTPDSETALLTGDIGSGKSTLVDALTTLLLPAHRIAYNKAAGATSRERDLRSYVEGHYKSERIEASGRSRAIGLRSGTRTYSVILGVFVNDGYAEEVTLAQVFQQRESTGQPYRFYVTAKKSLSIAVDFADFGADLRDLRKRLRDSGAEIFDAFPRYGTTLRRALGIRSEQALELFHQTVSMKSVGNLNEFVRDHMLEPSDPTRRVNDIIAHFEDLTKAHNAVKRAREQLQALQPVVQMAAKYDEAIHTRGNLENERSAVELFITELRLSLLTQEIDQFEEVYQRLKVERETEEAAQQSLADERDALIEERARAGGDRVGELERLIREAHAQAEKRGEARRRFEAAVAVAGLPAVVDAQGFAELEATVAEARVRLAGEKRELDAAAANAIGNAKQLEVRREEISGELTSLEQRTSNLPVEQVDVRAHMCADLGLSPQDLPYAGELLDVYEDRAE